MLGYDALAKLPLASRPPGGAGTVAGVATAAAVGRSTAKTVATSAGVATAAGTAKLIKRAVGTSDGAAAASVQTIAVSLSTGTSAGTSTATVVGYAIRRITILRPITTFLGGRQLTTDVTTTRAL